MLQGRTSDTPFEFTITCTEHGRYVIFYNERFDEVTYPIGYKVSSIFEYAEEWHTSSANESFEMCVMIMVALIFDSFLLSDRSFHIYNSHFGCLVLMVMEIYC